jgi:hypothetical protein
MKYSAPRFLFSAAVFSTIVSAISMGMFVTSCTLQEEGAKLLEDPPADSVTFWPPSLHYAKFGDTLTVRIHGLKRQYDCATTLELRLAFREDTTKAQYFHLRSRFEIPANPPCGREDAGLDTGFKAQISTREGRPFYLEKADSTRTDSIVFVAPSSQAFLDAFDHIPSMSAGAGTTVHGRYIFRDSTASQRRWLLRVDSLAACEILQTAVFDRRGDTLAVRVRRILAKPLPESILPACAGTHADSLSVVFNAHKFP